MTIVRNLIVPQIEPRGQATGIPLITTVSLPAAEVAAAYSFQMTATGGTPPYTWSISSAVPDGTVGITTGGLIQWTPVSTTGNPGNEIINIKVTDSLNAPTAPTAFNVSVYPALSITTTSLPSTTTGTAYSATLAATGGLAPYTWSITGQDSHGFPALNTSTGALSGTASQAETLSIVATVTDSIGGSATQTFPLTVTSNAGALSIFTLNLPYATQNIAYSQPLQATGGSGNYTWSLTSPITPSFTGITLAANGVLSGTCTSIIDTTTSPTTITVPAQVTDGTTTLTRTYTFPVRSQPLQSYSTRTDQAVLSFTPPALTGAINQIVTDDISGFRILRVTNGNTDPGHINRSFVSNGDGSAEECGWSALGNYFSIANDGNQTYFYSFNKSTFQATALTVNGSLFQNFFIPQWDPVVDTVAYGKLLTNNTVITKMDVLTGVQSVAWDCSALSAQYGVPGDLSVADNLNICVRFGPQDTAHAVAVLAQGVQHVYDTFAQTIDGVSTGLPTGVGIHNARMGQDGRYVRISSNTATVGGIFFWDITTNNVIHPAPGSISGHQVQAWGQFLQGNNTAAISFSAVNAEIADVGPTSLINFKDLYHPPSGLYPGPASDEYMAWANRRQNMNQPVFFMSVGNTNTTAPTLPYMNEHMVIQTNNPVNAGGTCWRVGRTYGYYNGDFFDLCQGNISRDGHYILWHSTWTNTLGTSSLNSLPRKDVFIRELQGNTNWQTLKVGAGGFVRGLSVANDGTMVGRTDTAGAYLWNGTNWVQLVTAATLPASLINTTDISVIGQGVFELVMVPSNSSTMYMMYHGLVFKSTNKGTTWTQTAFTQVSDSTSANPNDSFAQYGQKMAIDPNNSNIVYVGTEANGLFVTTNGGTTWSAVAGVPAGSGAGVTGILFFGNGPVVGGVTQTIYAASNGNGMYKSTDGGNTWTLMTNGLSTIFYAALDTSGNVYAVGPAGLTKASGTNFVLLVAPGGNPFQAVAINPFNNNELMVVDQSGIVNHSTNAGATWTGLDFTVSLSTGDIPWLQAANLQGGVGPGMFLSAGGAAFSPTTNGQLILSAGTGVWLMSVPPNMTSATALTWTDQSVGIENIQPNAILIPPTAGASPVLASWDRPFFKISNLNAYPSTYGPVASDTIEMGWSLDYASSDPTKIFGLSYWNNQLSGTSTDGGATWTKFPTPLANITGGTIAASTPTNILVAQANKTQPVFTTNGGSTWTGVTLPGVTNWNGFHTAYFFNQRSCCADRVLANTFYLYYPGQGVFRSTNSGTTWTLQKSGFIESNSSFAGFNSTLLAVPGNAGQLFYTSGPLGGTTPSSPVANPLFGSVDGGATWTAAAGITAVSYFCFGAVAPLASYPSIYAVGFVGGVFSVWRSTDGSATWVNIGYPNMSLDLINCIASDPNKYGAVYVGFKGGGYAYLSN